MRKLSDGLTKDGYKITGNTKQLSAFKDNRYSGTSSIYVDYDESREAGKWHVNCNSKVITKSESLADPKANYQTTSARRVSFKTIKGSKYFDSHEKIGSFIDDHKSKIDK